jgi:hypothetical protein
MRASGLTSGSSHQTTGHKIRRAPLPWIGSPPIDKTASVFILGGRMKTLLLCHLAMDTKDERSGWHGRSFLGGISRSNSSCLPWPMLADTVCLPRREGLLKPATRSRVVPNILMPRRCGWSWRPDSLGTSHLSMRSPKIVTNPSPGKVRAHSRPGPHRASSSSIRSDCS